MILSDLNISPAKQINFPTNFFHSANYFCLVYVYEGSGILKYETDSYPLNAGDCFFIPPETNYLFNCEPGSIAIWLMMRNKYISANYKQLFKKNPIALSFFESFYMCKNNNHYLLFHTTNSNFLKSTLLDIFDEYLEADDYSSASIDYLFNLFITYLLRDSSAQIESSIAVSPIELQYNMLFNYLNANYRTATLTSASEYVHFSKQYVCRILKLVRGETFSQILRGIRINLAKEYLLNTGLSLESIADLVGFSDSPHLSRVFKQEIGLTPSEFKEKNRARS